MKHTKFIGIALFLLANITVMVSSCMKETLTEPTNTFVIKKKLLKARNVRQEKVILDIKNVLTLKNDAEVFYKIIKKVDTSLTGKYLRGEISEDILFESLSPDLQSKILEAIDLFNMHLTKIRKQYAIESYDDIEWEKSFIQVYHISYKNVNKCDEEYALVSARNFAAFVATSAECITWIELPPVAAGCVMAASAYYAYDQQKAVDAYNDCLKNN